MNWKTCDKISGGYPGSRDEEPWPSDMSHYLQEVNLSPQREGTNIYTLLSMFDEVHPPMVYSRFMSKVPSSNETFIFNSSEYTHLGVRDLTTELQFKLVASHDDISFI